jgi:hypothetical protein
LVDGVYKAVTFILAMADNKGEQSFDLNSILQKVTDSVIIASKQLHDKFYDDNGELKDYPYVYTIPSTKVTLKLTIGYSNGKIKGVFKKNTTSSSQEMVSTVDLEIVSIPRSN